MKIRKITADDPKQSNVSFSIPLRDVVNGVRGIINRNGDFYSEEVLKKAYEKAQEANQMISMSCSSKPVHLKCTINKPAFLNFETGVN